MVVLHEVLGDELPVRLDLVRRGAGDLPLVHAIPGEAPPQVADQVVERPRGGVEAHDDERAEAIDAYGVETEVGLVERLDIGHVEDAALVERAPASPA